MPDITFSDNDFQEQDDPMVITIEVANSLVLETLVDQRSLVDILYWKTFKRLGLAKDVIGPMEEQIVGFSGERVDTRGYIDLYTKFGEGNQGYRTIMVRYLIINANMSYNVLLGRSKSKNGDYDGFRPLGQRRNQGRVERQC